MFDSLHDTVSRVALGTGHYMPSIRGYKSYVRLKREQKGKYISRCSDWTSTSILLLWYDVRARIFIDESVWKPGNPPGADGLGSQPKTRGSRRRRKMREIDGQSEVSVLLFTSENIIKSQ